MKLYIAYGSNLNLRQMKHRCPGARVLYKGFVEDYSLVFRCSKTWAYASIIPKKGGFVPVVVWEINAAHEYRLDIYEGYPNFYYKKELPVILDNGEIIMGMAYIMFDEAKPGLPSDAYLKVCKQGYRDNDFSIEIFNFFVENNLRELGLELGLDF